MSLIAATVPGCFGLDRATMMAVAAGPEDVAVSQRLVARGRSQFLHCNACHVADAAAPPPFGDDLGPHLEGIVGRPAGIVEGFDYSEAVLGLDLVWDEEALDEWLQRPQALVPGMCEPFTGIANAEQRRALIAYLKTPAN